MNLRSKHLEAASLLICLVKVFCVNTLTCHPTEYQTGNECCPLCPSGNRVKTHCTEFRSTSCLPCVNDTFMNLPTGLKQCLPCTTCGPDSGLKIYTSCTATTDSLCEPLEGFYCIDPIQNHCAAAQKHKQCQPGQYIKHRGTAQTDSQCSDCSVGTFSDGTRTSCQPHTQCESLNLKLMQPGTASTDAECGNSSLKKAPVAIIVAVFFWGLVIALVALCFWKWKGYRSGTMCVWWKKMFSWMIRPPSSHGVVDSEVFHLFCFYYRKKNKCILSQKGTFVTLFHSVCSDSVYMCSLLDDNTWLMKVM
ncbi:tumor necrosis factor receptor superfamily member 14-like isoform X2 [Hippoglossus hippoglossus]|uniref:tumor necrosis factor receptor superfamily member 14-like isoform X2 n=1 Tax=Hippoglossus hippoglossus TaxID=8267 RepID=UPI00148D9385|nr:tumor necrosis factor receptor superfamily member 14-like isoform X2 [Hippoglossus hippoglossus]